MALHSLPTALAACCRMCAFACVRSHVCVRMCACTRFSHLGTFHWSGRNGALVSELVTERDGAGYAGTG
jgi:hypothetical protein